jgi:hypothetical protein
VRKFACYCLALTTVLMIGCSRATNTGAGLQEQLKTMEQEITQLKAQVKAKDEVNADLKRSLTMVPPPPNEPRVAAGDGDGRFVVVPSTVRPGDTIAIYNDLPSGDVRLYQKGIDNAIARFPGPKARNFLLYPLAKDLPAGEYLMTISGPGGWAGQAVIKVEQGE